MAAMGWLEVRDIEVALVRSGRQLPEHHSPRPYLHPVRTLAGEVLTAPADHPHHRGLSLVIADDNGTTFWGGPTYVAGQGYLMLANHGRQSGPPPLRDPEAVVLELDWTDVEGRVLAREQRSLSAHAWDDGWSLHWHSRLTAGADNLVLGSPATRGRTDAGYGGLFWRVSGERQTRVTSEVGEGVAVVHGSTSRWLALEQARGHDRTATLLLAQPAEAVLPWFGRTEGYVGAGPAVAWSQPRRVPAGSSLELALAAGLRDRELRVGDAESLLAHAAALDDR